MPFNSTRRVVGLGVYMFILPWCVDLFKCQTFSHKFCCIGAKRDAKPMLALATEQGTVHVVDASKRKDWDSGALNLTYY